ncbi:AAA family ATPase [Streptomyces sp. NPDC057367]|uniref:AAA family ATPase n=1 Tax=Streptomyces sp. NPDC057367 TaxID=3346108 RepID=UPI0036296F51
MRHLTIRVAWHDTAWDGRVCAAPSRNGYCTDLQRIRVERDDAAEDAHAGRDVSTLSAEAMPPCQAESGLFMNPQPWTRYIDHPYTNVEQAKGTHGALRTAKVLVPPFSTFATPFSWMLKERQSRIDERLPDGLLPPEDHAPFPTPWVFSGPRQQALLDHVFGQVTRGRSLALFYTKSGHPLGDHIPRLVVGVGRVTDVGRLLPFPQRGVDGRLVDSPYPAWDRLVSHSIRPQGEEGLLLPYHAYLASTGDPAEDARRRALLSEVAVGVDNAHVNAFSYGAELAGPDVALATLVRCQEAVRAIRAHGIAPGPWEAREDWLNERIAEAWTDRGAFPGAGAALEALGLRLGSSLVRELRASGTLASDENPWPLLGALLEGRAKSPSPAYDAPLRNARGTWRHVASNPAKRDLLHVLSRFDLTLEAAARWFRTEERNRATLAPIDDPLLLANPYRISEADLGDQNDPPVPLSTIDLGVFPDDTVSVKHPLPTCTPPFGDTLDPRRVRAGLVDVLRRAAEDGDTLLSAGEAVTRLAGLRVGRPPVVPVHWLEGNRDVLAAEVQVLDVLADPDGGASLPAVQLTNRGETAKYLGRVLGKRAGKAVPSTGEDWTALLRARLAEQEVPVADGDERAQTALAEQAAALERITTRRLAVLVGRAGTGKTTVLGALQRSRYLQSGGMLFLAPTGKATVRLAQKTGTRAYTVAQFLHQHNRYDGLRQRPLFSPPKGTAGVPTAGVATGYGTVVIDECSMLSEDDLRACLEALDLGVTKRLILVGDPNQLPPIGPGRPFADLVSYLEAADETVRACEERGSEPDRAVAARAGALARLTVELRTAAGAPSAALRLASWYTAEQQRVDADDILSELAPGGTGPAGYGTVSAPADTTVGGGAGAGSDLVIRYWNTAEELDTAVLETLVDALDLSGPRDIEGFNKALGLTSEGWVPFDDHSGAHKFQVLSPVRMGPHGVHELNRLLQRTFRGSELDRARRWGRTLGPEEIVDRDKVILLQNGERTGYDHGRNQRTRPTYLANGEVGLVSPRRGPRSLSVAFADREQVRFDFSSKDVPRSGGGALELAYALTVHKAQGSEFDTVIVVIPATGRLMSRELLYTALTRAKTRLVLLVEGTDTAGLLSLAAPDRSETARRNTNVFSDAVRRADLGVPFADHLIHRTSGGLYVRSKSELIIANLLEHEGVPFAYERKLPGEFTGGYRLPDFTFTTDDGDTIVWEHLGMLDRDDYRAGWERKRQWYEANGFIEGQNLFTSSESHGPRGGLSMPDLHTTLDGVRAALESDY